MDILRDASNQQELKFAQRQLAATQRYSEKYELPSKVLSGAPQFIAKEARIQAAWVEERKKEKAHSDSKASIDPMSDCCDTDDANSCDFQVECRKCNLFFSWSDLAAGDGCCITCSSALGSSDANRQTPAASTCDVGASAPSISFNLHCENSGVAFPVEELLVECAVCGISAPWSLLSVGDGTCPECIRKSEPTMAEVASSCSASLCPQPEESLFVSSSAAP